MKKILLGLAVAMAAFGVAVAEDAPLTVTDTDGTVYTGDAAAGEKLFKVCVQCHALKEGENKIGPTLFGIVGRHSASVEGFNYSKANQEADVVWDPQTLFDYLLSPRTVMPGTKMAYAGMKKPQDRADLIAYLKAAGAAPAP